jgi:cell shape-determining protein MreD
MPKTNIGRKLKNYGPIILLYYLSISEVDTHFENYFEILSFNLQLIIVYFWALKRPMLLGSGHIFFAGLINDVVMGFPLGLSSLSYLAVALVAGYIKNMSVHTTLTSDWFTFLIALIISNFVFSVLASNFSEIVISSNELSYNTFFTLIFFPFFWFLFSYYNTIVRIGKNA